MALMMPAVRRKSLSPEVWSESGSAWPLAIRPTPGKTKKAVGVSRTWHLEASDADAIGIEAVPRPGTVWHGGRPLAAEISRASQDEAVRVDRRGLCSRYRRPSARPDWFPAAGR